jgi:hypothetical protein
MVLGPTLFADAPHLRVKKPQSLLLGGRSAEGETQDMRNRVQAHTLDASGSEGMPWMQVVSYVYALLSCWSGSRKLTNGSCWRRMDVVQAGRVE